MTPQADFKLSRHPLGRVITIAYFSLIKISDYTVTPASFAQSAKWHSVGQVGDLAFDHNEILDSCLKRLKRKVRMAPIGFELLPPKFTLTELQQLYESILAPPKGIDKRNFRKKVLATGLLIETDEVEQDVAHRAARLFRFDEKAYRKLEKDGFVFDLI